MGTAQTARADECALLPRAVELLEAAYDRGELSLGTLCQVHALLVDAPAGIGGRLRNGPAVVRLEGLMTFVPPPAAAARSGAEMFAAALTEQLSTASQDVPPPVLAAQASARFTDLHPFADGNGRVARAIATWLLVRAGYRPKPGLSLDRFCHRYQVEHYRALWHHKHDPRAWHQFFLDAVLACFAPPCS
jgi:Fic family protein